MCQRLHKDGFTVVAGCGPSRDFTKWLNEQKALGYTFHASVGNVGDWDSTVSAFQKTKAELGSIDVLVNNAGVHGPYGDPSGLTAAEVLSVLEVNVVGVVRTTTAFLPLLRRSADPVIINVSSSMGSLAATHDPARAESRVISPAYTASKAALTMLTTQYAKALPGIRINAADPGYTATDLNGHSGPQTVTEGTDAIVGLATEGPGHGSGRFVDRAGEIAWS